MCVQNKKKVERSFAHPRIHLSIHTINIKINAILTNAKLNIIKILQIEI